MKQVLVRKVEVIETDDSGRQLFEVLKDTQLGRPLGLAKTGSIVELLQGTTSSKHLKPLGDFEQTGDPGKPAVFQLVEAAI